jgi:hypothetical protein
MLAQSDALVVQSTSVHVPSADIVPSADAVMHAFVPRQKPQPLVVMQAPHAAIELHAIGPASVETGPSCAKGTSFVGTSMPIGEPSPPPSVVAGPSEGLPPSGWKPLWFPHA